MTLKTHNVPQVGAFIVANALLIAAVFLGIDLTAWEPSRVHTAIIAALIAPIVVAVLNALLTHSQKAVLVFWRWRHPLPAHQAFSAVANSSPRIDVSALKNKVKPWPVEPAAQNLAWLKLFRKHERDPVIAESHRLYLLMRDLTALAFLFTVLCAGALAAAPSLLTALVYLAGLVGCYLLFRLAASRYGFGLVANVLSKESTDLPAKKEKR
jgi:hypothetical protein